VYRPADSDAPVFTGLPRLSTSDVVRHGVVEADPETSWVDAGDRDTRAAARFIGSIASASAPALLKGPISRAAGSGSR